MTDRRWELGTLVPFWTEAFFVGIAVGVWLGVEGGLAVPTILAATNPFDFGWQVNGWPTSWRAMPLTTLFGLPLVGWTAIGVGVVVEALRNPSGNVVVAGAVGVRVERRTRRGRRVLADLAWSEIRHLEMMPFAVVLVTDSGRRVEVPVASRAERGEIADIVREHLGSEPPGGQSPFVPEWTAYLDDRGPTLIKDRSKRRTGAWVTGGLAALGWVNSAVLATGLDEGSGWWWLTGVTGAATLALTYATYRLARFTPRWTATPGAVVRIDNRGAEVTFTARSLEHRFLVQEDGGDFHALDAVSTKDGGDGAVRRQILLAGRDPRPVVEAGRWLASAAEIPFRGNRLPDEP